MGLKRQIERLRHWACPQAYDCLDRKYAIHGDWCPFDNVIRAADEGWTKKCIVDEYGDSYSPIDFLQEVNTPIEYQACCEFS